MRTPRSPHLFLSCGKEFMVDSEAPVTACPKCNAREIVDTWLLGGKPCPYCHTGVFDEEPGFRIILRNTSAVEIHTPEVEL